MLRGVWFFLFIGAIALVLAATGHAYSKPRHHVRHHHIHLRPAEAPVFPVFWSTIQPPPAVLKRPVRVARAVRPVPVSDSSVVEAARSQVGNGPVYGRRNLWCARFVNYVLQRTGHRGTGSDLAWSFASLPRAGMQVGAIAVMRHHVGIVSGVSARGNPILISGNNAGRVRETEYPRSRVAAFVEAR